MSTQTSLHLLRPKRMLATIPRPRAGFDRIIINPKQGVCIPLYEAPSDLGSGYRRTRDTFPKWMMENFRYADGSEPKWADVPKPKELQEAEDAAKKKP